MTMRPPAPADPALRARCVDTIRMLSVDAIETAKSGHPGAPLGLAETAFTLWSEFLRFDPKAPQWPDRDRFVLSAGHASMLLYSLLHLFGYDLPLEEIRGFRQWGSRTAGHPEFGHAPGVEMTTGPLGQGISTAVGMALGARLAAARFNTDDFSPVRQRVWVIASDGDLMEGVTSEAASLAGHLRLGGLKVLYDSNDISLDGPTRLSFCEDVGARFAACGWRVDHADGNDPESLRVAMSAAATKDDRPSLVIVKTVIGRGSPGKQGTAEAHGSPLGAEEARKTKEFYGWPAEPLFHVPAGVREACAAISAEAAREHAEWAAGFARWKKAHPDLAALWERHATKAAPEDLDRLLCDGLEGVAAATRVHSGAVIQRLAEAVPALAGGSADLESSNNTRIRSSSDVAPPRCGETPDETFRGRNLRFGVREHAMGAIVNGLALQGQWLPYGATFLVFSDYLRPALRLSCLMGLRTAWVFTHDSVLLGEDGPTHQPVEHLWALRGMPNLTLFRPADGIETAMAWAWIAMRAEGPVALALSRQKLPALARPAGWDRREVWRGGYVLAEAAGAGDAVTLLATGSEVHVALEAKRILAEAGTAARVVSMPSVERFRAQDRAWRESVLPPGGRVAVIEAGSTLGWAGIAGSDALVVGIDRFGASAPAERLQEEFGFTPARVAERVRAWLVG